MAARKETEIAVSIPLHKIRRIEIYQNTKKLRLSTIMSETGAAYAINGTLYNMKTGKPVCPLRADGKTLFGGSYTYYGYSWDNVDPSSFGLDRVPDKQWDNYIACSCVLKDSEALKRPIYNVAQGGKRGRTAIGTKKVNGEDRLCLYVSKDGSSAKRTPEQLGALLKSYGWRDAVMLDCGTSSQGYFDKEKRQVYSGRRCAHYILIYM